MIMLIHQTLFLITLCILTENKIQINVNEIYFDCYNRIQKTLQSESNETNLNNSFKSEHFVQIDKYSKNNFGIYTCIDQDKTLIELTMGYKNIDFDKNKSSSSYINCLIDYNEYNYEVEIGSTISLKCNCASKKNIRIIWYKNDSKLNESLTNFRIKFENNKTLLRIKNIKLTDSGQYICGFFNVESRIKLVYNVNVIGFENPTKQILSIGDTAMFDCIFYSNITKNASFIKLSGLNNLLLNKTKITEDNFTQIYLVLSNVTIYHTGTYSCLIETKFGLFEKQFSLIVHKDLRFEKSSKWLITKTIVIVILLIVISIALLSFYKIYNQKSIYFLPLKSFKKKLNNKKVSEIKIVELKHRKNILKFKNSNEDKNTTPFCFEVNRKNLIIEEIILGSGYFGVIKKAIYKTNLNTKNVKSVAVKMLKTNYSTSDFNKLIQELQIMSFIGSNKNVVQLIGFCTNNLEKEQLLIIYEYASNGNLKNFLINLKSLGSRTDIKNFINFAYQIANGMEFISSKKCLHRNLAARNILMFQDNVIKISDFGLTKIVNNDFFKLNVNDLGSYKWLAFESLNHLIYTSKSDVWMFGVLIWEMYTLGDNPYNNVQTFESLIQYLINGNRLQKPTLCPDIIFNFMEKCWLLNQHKRPNFFECKLFFNNQI